MSKRIALITASAVALVGGGAAAICGGAVLAVFGTDNTISSGQHPVSTTTSALVTEQGDFGAHSADILGHPAVKISVTSSAKPVFVGVGPAAAVDRYLAGAAVETVTDFELRPFDLTTTRREGTVRLAPPLEQSFWVAKSVGSTSAATDWKVRDGSYRVVLMNADGSAGVDVESRFGLGVPHLAAIGATVLAGGLLFVVVGVALLLAGLRTRSQPLGQPIVGAVPADLVAERPDGRVGVDVQELDPEDRREIV
jgi:hypothetical protein